LSIHPSATVGEQATISPEAEIGPYCVIEGQVEIGAHTLVESHARIGGRFGRVTIGEHNHIQNGAVLGGPAQDLGYQDGGYTALAIGNHNRIGEFVSINLGSEKGGGITRVGDHNFIMAYVHIGHDCQLADHIVVTNGAQFAGHVVIEHHALISGLVGVTQFCRLGAYCFLVAGAFTNKDIPPFTIAEGHWATPRATNRVGLKRAGFDSSERRNIDHAVRLLLDRKLTIEEVAAAIQRQCSPSPQIEHFVNFLKTSDRGIARG
jgi:UDP-N-acetylglucosamine acyltransferase